MTNKKEEVANASALEPKTVTITCGSFCVKNPEKCRRCGLAKLKGMENFILFNLIY